MDINDEPKYNFIKGQLGGTKKFIELSMDEDSQTMDESLLTEVL